MTRPVTTIVTGIPRSGTSLMMSILEAAGMSLLVDRVRTPDVSNPRGYFEYEPVVGSERDTSWVDAAAGRVVKVIQTLLPTLPRDRDYRVILMERPITEIVLSQNRMLGRLAGSSPQPSSKRIEEAFASQLERTRDFLARSDCIEWLAVAYPDLVHTPDPSLARVSAFLELEARFAEMKACIEPSLYHEATPQKVRRG